MDSKLAHRINTLIPSHIVEQYPHFVQYLKGYYEWLSSDKQPFNVISNHLDWLSFKQSLEEYTNFMKDEYLYGIPEDIMFDKELFIKWSKNFNSARGSRQSIKFLFEILFNEQVEVYLPKRDILRTSDGKWIDKELELLVSVPSNIELDIINIQRVRQEKEVAPGFFEYSYAEVERLKQTYNSKHIVTHLYIKNIEGDIDYKYPLLTENNDELFIYNTGVKCEVINKGYNHQKGELLNPINHPGTYDVTLNATEANRCYFNIQTFFKSDEITVYINDAVIDFSSYTYINGMLVSNLINVNDIIKIVFPTHKGNVVVDEIDQEGGVLSVNIVSPSININDDIIYESDKGCKLKIVAGTIKELDGYYINTDGHLSSDKVLQDSFFYQDYSYAIRTEQDIEAYKDILLNVLHPAGMKLFGIINILNIIKMIVKFSDMDINILPKQLFSTHRYGVGPTVLLLDKLKLKLDGRVHQVYQAGYNDDLSYLLAADIEYYKLYDTSFVDRDLFKDLELKEYYGWMKRINFADYTNIIPQEYSEYDIYKGSYFESGYVSTRIER